MSEAQNTPEMSVLDEIRSTIASLDAIRNKTSTDPAVVRAETVSTLPNAVEPQQAAQGALPTAKPPETHVAEPSACTSSEEIAPVQSEQSSPDEAMPPAAPTGPAQLDEDAVEASLPSSDDENSEAPSTDSKIFLSAPATTPGPESVLLRHANKEAKIMIVDDEPLNIMTFRQHLKGDGYVNFVSTEDSRTALMIIRDELPDVLLLDIHMPHVTGLDIMRVMGLDPLLQHIPVLILTAATDPRVRRKALDLGASDFLSKPVDPNELIPRVRNAVILKKHYDMVANEAARLEQQVERRTRQLEATRQQLIVSLARAAEHRDNDTGNHVIRVGRYAAIIAEALGYPQQKLEMLEQAAQLHDVGKIGIPDSVLFKPGKLDRDQYDLMKRHCAIGKQIIEPFTEKEWEVLKKHTRRGESLLHVRSSPLMMLAARIAQTHHEKWDGSGYPLGLAGEDIPLEGRIVAVADVFDALSSERPYKKAFPREKCFEILEEGRETHFDPKVLDAFMTQSERIIETQLLLMDEQEQIDTAAFTE